MADLSVAENQWYNSAANRANQNYDLGTAQNAYDRSVAAQGAAWDREDITRQYKQAAQKFTAGYGQRGLYGSGIMQQKLGQFNTDQFRAIGRQQVGWDLKNQGYDLAQSQLGTARDNALWDLQLQKEAMRRTLASAIQ